MDCSTSDTSVVRPDSYLISCSERVLGLETYCIFLLLEWIHLSSRISSSVVQFSEPLRNFCRWQMQEKVPLAIEQTTWICDGVSGRDFPKNVELIVLYDLKSAVHSGIHKFK